MNNQVMVDRVLLENIRQTLISVSAIDAFGPELFKALNCSPPAPIPDAGEGADDYSKFEAWHDEAYGPQGKYNPIRSLDRWPEETGLGYQDDTVAAQFFAYCGAARIVSALQPRAMVAPSGWQLVPVEPTQEMVAAGDKDYSFSVAKTYRAMLAASCAWR
jgi:hypothetical protein